MIFSLSLLVFIGISGSSLVRVTFLARVTYWLGIAVVGWLEVTRVIMFILLRVMWYNTE
jgi:hypothetical protein